MNLEAIEKILIQGAEVQKQIKEAITIFLKLKADFERDGVVTKDEFKKLEEQHDYLIRTQALILAMEDRSREYWNAKRKTIDDAYQKYKKIELGLKETMKSLIATPNSDLLGLFNKKHTDYRIAKNKVEEIYKGYKDLGDYTGNNLVRDVERRHKELLPLLEKVEQISRSIDEQWSAQIEANIETSKDAASSKVSNLSELMTLFQDLHNRLDKHMSQLMTDYIGFQKSTVEICVQNINAENEFKKLMAAQNDETTKSAAIEEIVKSLALSLANIIFPGISTPLNTLLNGTLKAVLDTNNTEFRTVSVKVGRATKQIQVNEGGTKDNSKNVIAAIGAFKTAFEGLSAALKNPESKETEPSKFVPANAQEAFIKAQGEVANMIHNVAVGSQNLFNTLTLVITELSRLRPRLKFLNDVDTAPLDKALQEMYKLYAHKVNSLLSQNKLKVPTVNKADVKNKFLKAMLLKWTPSLELRKTRTRIEIRTIFKGGRWRQVERRWSETYSDFPPLIVKELQSALVKYAELDKALMDGLPYDRYTNWTTYDETSDALIKKIVSSAKSKQSSLENWSIWKSTLGL